MKNNKSIILLTFVIFAFSISACQKEPTASFTTVKTEYYAGEIVHLSNTSVNGNSFLWTMPDGTTITSKDADYTINSNIVLQPLVFKLEAISKNGRKENTAINLITATLKPKLLQNSFSIDNSIYGIDSKYNKHGTGNNYNYLNCENPSGGSYMASVTIFFPGNVSTNLQGIYTLQEDINLLTNGKACVRFSEDCYDCLPPGYHHYFISTSGQLIITYNKGILHAIFNDADARKDTTSNIIKISGNITSIY